MLDENLPTFYLKPSRQTPHQTTIHLYQHGNDPQPTYTLRHPDPTTIATPADAHNRYAAALYDAHVPSILYGEVLILPQWTTPTLSADAIRANNGTTPAPEPLLPTTFTINLYNPDQTVTVHFKPKSWNSPATWWFEMPQHSFRQPSTSRLDRTQADPASADITPKLRFAWRKDSKLSKDLTCVLSGKTTTLPESKTKAKEPDITVAMFQSLKELTLYEPNLYRVEMEDFKGLEVVLLLAAVTIRDVWFASQGLREAFRVGKSGAPAAVSGTGSGGREGGPVKQQRPVVGTTMGSSVAMASGALNASPSSPLAPSSSPMSRQSSQQLSKPLPQPAVSPAENWRKEEERRTRLLLEEEERTRRQREAERQAEIDRETLRLQRIYGQEEEHVRMQASGVPGPLPPRMSAAAAAAAAAAPPAPSLPLRPANPPQPHSYPYQDGRPRIHGAGRVDPRHQSVVRFSLSPEQQQQQQAQAKPALQPKKSSFFRLRRSSADETKLSKKRSSMF